MSANVSPFRWSGRSDRAAVLVAEDLRTDTEIATEAGITQRQLERWKRHPEFAARVHQVRDQMRAAVVAEGIANRTNRVAALNERWRRMEAVIEARAVEHRGVPGGSTGLLVRQVKLVKSYDSPAITEDGADVLMPTGTSIQIAEYAVDTALLKELREHERQAAQELGQWTEKRDLSGELLIREYVGVDIESV